MTHQRLGKVGEVDSFDSEEELASFVSIKQAWNLDTLKQSLVDISASMVRKGS